MARPGLTVIRKKFLEWINDKEALGGRKFRFRPRNRTSQYIFWSMRYRKLPNVPPESKYVLESRTTGSVRYSGAGGKAHISRPNNPFPINTHFKSETVLSEGVRKRIWRRVMLRGESLKAVSADMTIDVRRVAAVVRLKELEKQQMKEAQRNKAPVQLTLPYARAIMSMLPKWGGNIRKSGPFEPINEIHMHSKTGIPLFWPVSESRHFTRADAAQAFGPNILPADKRVPHPELIEYERALMQGNVAGRDQASWAAQSKRAFESAVAKSDAALQARADRQRKAEANATTRVMGDRCEFRFKDMNADDVGQDGRSRHGVGWRYGAPYYDRKRGNVKIPTSVE